jgi:hypothetical protein
LPRLGREFPGFKFAYDEPMKTSMPIQNLFTRTRKKVAALCKSVNHLIRSSVRKPSDGDNAEQWIAEFERLSGSGHSDGWRFDRDEIHRRR